MKRNECQACMDSFRLDVIPVLSHVMYYEIKPLSHVSLHRAKAILFKPYTTMRLSTYHRTNTSHNNSSLCRSTSQMLPITRRVTREHHTAHSPFSRNKSLTSSSAMRPWRGTGHCSGTRSTPRNRVWWQRRLEIWTSKDIPAIHSAYRRRAYSRWHYRVRSEIQR
jgi:hypothetical protein